MRPALVWAAAGCSIVCGWFGLAVALRDSDPFGEGRLETCRRLRRAPVGRVDAVFGMPRHIWPAKSFVCPRGLACSKREWTGPVRIYPAGIDASLIVYFEAAALDACELSGS